MNNPHVEFIVRDDNGHAVTPPRLLIDNQLITLRPVEDGWVLDDDDVPFVIAALGGGT